MSSGDPGESEGGNGWERRSHRAVQRRSRRPWWLPRSLLSIPISSWDPPRVPIGGQVRSV